MDYYYNLGFRARVHRLCHLGCANSPDPNSQSERSIFPIRAHITTITALLSAPVSVSLGKNFTFQCQFHVHEKDQAFYEGVTVGVLQRGGISLTLMTVASNWRRKDQNIIRDFIRFSPPTRPTIILQ